MVLTSTAIPSESRSKLWTSGTSGRERVRQPYDACGGVLWRKFRSLDGWEDRPTLNVSRWTIQEACCISHRVTSVSPTLSLLLSLADDVENFPLHQCGPSDDPDMHTAYLYPFRDRATRFLATAKRLGDPDLSELIVGFNTSPDYITDAYDLKAKLQCAIDYIREAANDPEYETGARLNSAFLDQETMSKLKSAKLPAFDLTKVIRFCEELNDSYRRANYLSCALIIRALMNHVPPIFGVQTFAQVVASSGKSVKAILGRVIAK
jgi:hypothetical protein